MTSDILAKIRGKAEPAADNGKQAPPRKLCLVASIIIPFTNSLK